MQRRGSIWISTGLLILALVLCVVGLTVGSIETSFQELNEAIINFDFQNTQHFAIWNLRMPRVFMTFLVGGALAMAGYLMQITINNPLAEPYILGTSSAASLGANLVFFGLIPISIAGIYMPAVVAFIFAMISTLLVIRVARRKGLVQGSKLLLGGIAMSSLLTSIVALLAYMSDSSAKLRTIVFWALGSFEQIGWMDLPVLFILVVLTILMFSLLYKHVNLLLLGRERASDLGLNVNRYYNLVLVGSVLIASVTVTLVGAVGFVGLIVPHFVRAIYGATNRWNLWNSMLIGGNFLMVCDIVGRLVYPPVGIPIGIVTSFFGVPFFVYLLLKSNYRFE